MIFGVICATGRGFFTTVTRDLDAVGYCDLLSDHFVPFLEKIGQEFRFQQDNASIHTAQVVREWFFQKRITGDSLACKVSRFDLIENVWALLNRIDYNYLCSPKNLEELEAVLHEGWDTLHKKTLRVAVCCNARTYRTGHREQWRPDQKSLNLGVLML